MNDYFARKSNTSLAVTQQSITSHWSRQPIFAHYTSIALEGNVEIGCWNWKVFFEEANLQKNEPLLLSAFKSQPHPQELIYRWIESVRKFVETVSENDVFECLHVSFPWVSVRAERASACSYLTLVILLTGFLNDYCLILTSDTYNCVSSPDLRELDLKPGALDREMTNGQTGKKRYTWADMYGDIFCTAFCCFFLGSNTWIFYLCITSDQTSLISQLNAWVTELMFTLCIGYTLHVAWKWLWASFQIVTNFMVL